jgi:hypothetical protein
MNGKQIAIEDPRDLNFLTQTIQYLLYYSIPNAAAYRLAMGSDIFRQYVKISSWF